MTSRYCSLISLIFLPDLETQIVGQSFFLVTMEAKEKQFYAKLMSSYSQVLSYENPHLQDLYISHVPLDDLQKRAAEFQQTKVVDEKKEMSLQDCLLHVLLKWFKCKKHFAQL